MNDFLNAKSMSTPGAAGGIMMVLANAIHNNFQELPFRYVCVALSFAIGAIVFASIDLNRLERVFFWFINSLVIFAIGVGTSNIGANFSTPQQGSNHAALSGWMAPTEAIASGLSSTAYAQASSRSSGSAPELELKQRNDQLKQQNVEQQHQIEQLERREQSSTTSVQRQRNNEGFFNRW